MLARRQINNSSSREFGQNQKRSLGNLFRANVLLDDTANVIVSTFTPVGSPIHGSLEWTRQICQDMGLEVLTKDFCENHLSSNVWAQWACLWIAWPWNSGSQLHLREAHLKGSLLPLRWHLSKGDKPCLEKVEQIFNSKISGNLSPLQIHVKMTMSWHPYLNIFSQVALSFRIRMSVLIPTQFFRPGFLHSSSIFFSYPGLPWEKYKFPTSFGINAK